MTQAHENRADPAPSASAEEPNRSNWVEMTGLVLLPVAVILIVLAIVQAIIAISHWASLPSYPANPNGVSSTRQYGSILLNVAGAAIGPLAAAFLWFDWIGSGMSKRSRLALIGYVGGMLALVGFVAPTLIDPWR